jgi:hypothetical protein
MPQPTSKLTSGSSGHENTDMRASCTGFKTRSTATASSSVLCGFGFLEGGGLVCVCVGFASAAPQKQCRTKTAQKTAPKRPQSAQRPPPKNQTAVPRAPQRVLALHVGLQLLDDGHRLGRAAHVRFPRAARRARGAAEADLQLGALGQDAFVFCFVLFCF